MYKIVLFLAALIIANPDLATKTVFAAREELKPKEYELNNSYFKVVVDRQTGWPKSIISLNPTPCELLKADPPFVLSLKTDTNDFISLSQVSQISENINGFVIKLIPEKSQWSDKLEGQISYSLEGDMLRCKATVKILEDNPACCEIRCGFGFDPHAWARQFYPTIPHDNIIVAEKNGYKKINQGPYVLSEKQGEKKLFIGSLPPEDQREESAIPWSSTLNVPFMVVENDDRLLACACFDTGWPVLFAIDSEGGKGTFPMVLRFPRSMQKGKEYTFDFCLKSFAKPENSYAQVMRWYINNAYSSNPISSTAVGRKYAKIPPRAISALLGWGGTGGYKPGPNEIFPNEQVRVEDGTSLLWWSHTWSVFDELYPLDDRDYFNEWQFRWTKEDVKAEIQREKNIGLFPMMYKRSFLIWENCSDDKPPFKSWTKDVDLPLEKRSIEIQDLTPELQKIYGVQKIHKVLGDFTNNEFRDWYVSQACRELDYYQPSGVAWDMGDSGNLGNIDVMKRIRDYAMEKYPWMRFGSNEGCFQMSSLHSDAIVVESFEIGGKSELAFQCAKAFDAPIFNLIYSMWYQYPEYTDVVKNGMGRPSDVIPLERVKVFGLRYRIESTLPPEFSVISLRLDNWLNGRLYTLVSGRDLIADGSWHTLWVDLDTNVTSQIIRMALGHDGAVEQKNKKAYITSLIVELPSRGDKSVNLEIEKCGFYPERLTEDNLFKPQAVGDNLMYFDDFNNLVLWHWQPEMVNGVAIFSVDAGAPNKKWLKTDIRPYYRGLARGIGLGGLPAVGNTEPEEMPIVQSLLDFGRVCIRLHSVAEPMAIYASNPEVVKVSGWSGMTRTLVAAYNEKDAPVKTQLIIDLKCLKEKYKFDRPFTVDQMQIFNVETGVRPCLDCSIDRSEKKLIKLNVELGSNELLMIYAR